MANRVLIANAGVHPELQHLAAGLVRAEVDCKYITSLSWAEGEFLPRCARISSNLDRLVRKRLLPSVVTPSMVHRFGSGFEYVYHLTPAITQTQKELLVRSRNRWFQMRVLGHIKKAGPYGAVVAQHTSALHIFRAALAKTQKILNYPLVHHRWLVEEMRREASGNPSWARYLQHMTVSDRQLSEMDEEIALADLVLVASSFVADSFIAAGVDRQKVRVIPLGADGTHCGAKVPIMARDGVPSLNIVFAGQITQRKGISYLLEAFRQIASPGVTLSLVGRPYRGIEDQLKAEAGVKLVPAVSRGELMAILREADVLVLPSLAEGFGLVVAEAMSVGTPAIVSTATCASDIIDDGRNGFIVAPRDTDALVDRLRRLSIDRELLLGMSTAALESSPKFAWQRYEDLSARVVSEAASSQFDGLGSDDY